MSSLRELALAAHGARRQREEDEARQRAEAKRAENIQRIKLLLLNVLELDTDTQPGEWAADGSAWRTEGVLFWARPVAYATTGFGLVAGLPCAHLRRLADPDDDCAGVLAHQTIDSLADVGALLATYEGTHECIPCRRRGDLAAQALAALAD